MGGLASAKCSDALPHCFRLIDLLLILFHLAHQISFEFFELSLHSGFLIVWPLKDTGHGAVVAKGVVKATQHDIGTTREVGRNTPRGSVEFVALGALAATSMVILAAVSGSDDHTSVVGGGAPDKHFELAMFFEIIVVALEAWNPAFLPTTDGGVIW
jgi:hypothetical protein